MVDGAKIITTKQELITQTNNALEAKTMKTPSVCQKCQHVHGSDSTVAVGRFAPEGPIGYVAKDVPNSPVRPNREDADADYCLHLRDVA